MMGFLATSAVGVKWRVPLIPAAEIRPVWHICVFNHRVCTAAAELAVVLVSSTTGQWYRGLGLPQARFYGGAPQNGLGA